MFLFDLPTALEKAARAGIVWEPRLCSRVRFPRSKCEECLKGCPEQVISWDKTLKVLEGRCTECGLCISRCPNGVFRGQRRGDYALAREIARLLSGNSRNMVAFCCARSEQFDRDTVVLPCLGRLTESLLLAPFALGATRVEIRWPDCQGCSLEGYLSHLEGVLLLGRNLVGMVGRGEESIQVRRIGRYSQSLPTPSPCLSRRDFFRTLGTEAKQTVATLLPELGNDRPAGPWAHGNSAKRALLLDLIREFPQHTPTRLERKGLPFAEIEIGPGCVGCPVCATLCPTGALERVETPDGVDIHFRPAICTGCQICQEACLFQAISLSPTVDLQELAVRERWRLVHLTGKEGRERGGELLGIGEPALQNGAPDLDQALLQLQKRGLWGKLQ